MLLTLSRYQIQAKIYESSRSLVYRAIRKDNNQPVILKILKENYPTPEMLTAYQREYEMMHHLKELKGVVKACCLEKYQNTLVMCIEDFGGESLKSFITHEKLTVNTFLPLAIHIAESLASIHTAQVIHKDINPSNIVWNPTTHQLKIIDFGIASRLVRENLHFKKPEQLEGTLAYLSPEQTGRMNRSLDYRTDLYSLGITFYELLTGTVPFNSDRPLELVHCHLAKLPVPVHHINPEVPPILSDLVMKLMAKNAEDRYQSAFGVKTDLEMCQAQFKATRHIEVFKLAKYDYSGQFQISQKLYGRETEINLLLQAFERVTTSATQNCREIILMSGYSGVGKTSLVHEVHKPMTEKRGNFAAGKFDQFQRNIPYFALSQAFNKFCNDLLTEPSEVLKVWQEKILRAVGKNGQILTDVIPQLERLIGPQPRVAQVAHQAAKNRFEWIFKNFLRAICQPEHPLVLFIDDLQWADLASLNLLKVLMTDLENRYFLMIGAYRDNEVDALHPLTLTLKELDSAGVIIRMIPLKNLSFTEVNTLISESLSCEGVYTQKLTQLVYEKTQGNAFFTHEFLKSLYVQGLLSFDMTKRQWQWDIQNIQAAHMTDNVVALMVKKIYQLSTETQTVLKLASCIGNPFDLRTLSVIHKHSQSETLSHLWSAIEEGLLLPLDEHYRQSTQLENLTCQFKFQHDRLQQAAYSLTDEQEKPDLHLHIGEYLLFIHSDNLEENIFTCVDHLNLGASLVDTQTHKHDIAQLNLIAGLKAQTAMAYNAALSYFDNGLALLEANSWSTEYELTLKLYTAKIEAEFLNAHFEVVEQLSQFVLAHTQTLLDQIKIYEINILSDIAKNHMHKALETALQTLIKLGVQLNDQPSPNLEILCHTQLPIMQKAEKLAAMRILNFSISPSYTIAPERFPQIVLAMVNLSVQYGHSALSIFGYSTYGLLLCAAFGKIEMGYQVGQLAMSLINQFDAREFKIKGLTAYYVGVHHWKKPARETIEPLLEGGQNGIEVGDFEFVGVTAMHCGSYLFWIGEPLKSVNQTQSNLIARIQSVKQEYQQIYLNIWRQTVFNLQGMSTDPHRLVGEALDEDEMLPKVLKMNYGMAIFGIYLAKSVLCYLFKTPHQALEYAELAEPYEQANLGVMVVPIYRFYYSLILLTCYTTSTTEKQSVILKKVKSNQAQMKEWAFHAPQNYQHRYELVEAEMARVLGQLEAVTWYEQAIQHAHDHQYLQEEALAYELAAEFYVDRGMEKFTYLYLKEATYRYQQWGAVAKVTHLERCYPQWLIHDSPVLSSVETFSSTATVRVASTTKHVTASKTFDLESLMKASQTLFGERSLSCLLEKMMGIVIENAGAQRGLLLLPHNEQWVIEAEACVETHEVIVLQSLPIQDRLPEALVSYVARTHEQVVLANAKQEGLYVQHPYIKTHQTRSVLCFPVIYQQQLRAILYLENNVVTGAFTEERINLLKIFSAQMAIALENVQYANLLEEKVSERTAQLAEANQKIMALNEQLKEENLRMSAELNVARQLQKMVLPRPEELEQVERLEITGFMEAADEVGGDYYDVLVDQTGQVKIAVGDVTGHGLESGVLMLMLQTAIRSLFIAKIPPGKQFLSILNQIIYDCVQRTKMDKNLTLSILDYQEGMLRITGQHEDVLLVHSDGRVTPINTTQLGFPLGIVADIGQWLSVLEVQCRPEEGIVLYTDGLTEAQNFVGEQYGVARLCNLVSQNWHLPVKTIQQTIINDVQQYVGSKKINDDMTLLVLKHKS